MSFKLAAVAELDFAVLIFDSSVKCVSNFVYDFQHVRGAFKKFCKCTC